MEGLDLGNVAALAHVRYGVRGDPQDVDLAGLRVDLDPAGDRITERVGKSEAIRGQHIDRRTKGAAAVVRRGDPDLADREIVVGDVDLIVNGRDSARKYRHPGTIDERGIESGEVVDRPVCAAVVAEGEPSLEEKRGS